VYSVSFSRSVRHGMAWHGMARLEFSGDWRWRWVWIGPAGPVGGASERLLLVGNLVWASVFCKKKKKGGGFGITQRRGRRFLFFSFFPRIFLDTPLRIGRRQH
jgi:hypothetical protein